MKAPRCLFVSVSIGLALSTLAFQAAATHGYFAHGYGLKAKGLGGVATALAQDSFGGVNNPASMVWPGASILASTGSGPPEKPSDPGLASPP